MSDCIEWTGKRLPTGYGVFVENHRHIYIHRRAYEAYYGPIGRGLVVMHSCDNPPCYNPLHLSAGTHADNVADKVAKGRQTTNGNDLRTHCLRGHEFTPENTRVTAGRRYCRACCRIRAAEQRAGRRAA